MDRMGFTIGRVSQRIQNDLESGTFEIAYFLRNKGLGKTGVPLQDDCKGWLIQIRGYL